MQDFIIGIDIGGTHFRIGMVTPEGSLHGYYMEDSRVLHSEGDSLNNLSRYIENYMANNSMGRLIGIAIGFPSTISKDKKTVYSSPNIKGFDHVDVGTPLQKKFQVPVFIDNDVNFLLQCEIEKNNLHNKGIILGFYIGTGFGNAIYIEDHFLDGKNGSAAELGHIPVLGRNETCTCGNQGCIEIYASGKRLREIQQHYFTDTDIAELFTKHRQKPVIKDFVRALAVPIAIEINLLDPDYAIIGGGVPNMIDFPKEQLEEYICQYVRKPFPAQGLQLLYADTAQEAGVLGAAFYALKKLQIAKTI